MSELCSSKCHIRNSAGFTLIELLTTMAIVAILLGIGVPSFREFISSQRVKSAASEISSMLILARSEAIKRNRDVTIEQATGGWQNGWTVTTITPANPPVTVTLKTHEAFPSTLPVANAVTKFGFNGEGRLIDANAVQFTVQSTPATRCTTIGLTVSGMPTSKTKTGSC